MGRYLEIPGADYSSIAVGKVTPVVGRKTITTLATPTGAGSVSGGGSYNEGATATLTATASSGYKFSKWSDNDTTNPRSVTVQDNATYTAEFVDAHISMSSMLTLGNKSIDSTNNTIVSVGRSSLVCDTYIEPNSKITFSDLDSSLNLTLGFISTTTPNVGDSVVDVKAILKLSTTQTVTTTTGGYLCINYYGSSASPTKADLTVGSMLIEPITTE